MESIMVSGQLQVFPTMTGIIQIPSFPEQYETYSGPTNIIPSFFEQNLDTSEKVLKTNIKVFQIQTYETSNEFGTTFII